MEIDYLHALSAAFEAYLRQRGLYPTAGRPTRQSDELIGAFMAGARAAAVALLPVIQTEVRALQTVADRQVEGADQQRTRRNRKRKG
jgi:hypothetical protein